MTCLAPSQFIINIVRNRRKLQVITIIICSKIILANNIDIIMFYRFKRLRIK